MESFRDVVVALMARGFSQSQIARAAHVDRSRVTGWRQGNAVPAPLALNYLADEYGLDLDQLMRLCGYWPQQKPPPFDPEEQELLALYRRTPKPHRLTVRDMLRALVRDRPDSGASSSDEPDASRDYLYQESHPLELLTAV